MEVCEADMTILSVNYFSVYFIADWHFLVLVQVVLLNSGLRIIEKNINGEEHKLKKTN